MPFYKKSKVLKHEIDLKAYFWPNNGHLKAPLFLFGWLLFSGNNGSEGLHQKK